MPIFYLLIVTLYLVIAPGRGDPGQTGAGGPVALRGCEFFMLSASKNYSALADCDLHLPNFTLRLGMPTRKSLPYPRVRDPKTGRLSYDLTGAKFGRWTVKERNGLSYPQTAWRCVCDCGSVKDKVLYAALVNGLSTSCGCARTEKLRQASKHGRSHTKAHNVWTSMKSRCYDPNAHGYKHYGGRGITVCERWRDSFLNFYADMGEPPWGHTLDRKDNDGNYEPGNCRWADAFTQAGNRRNTTRHEWKGKARSMTEIAIMENVAFCSLRNKVKISGMTLEQAVADCRDRGLAYMEKAKAERPSCAES